MEVEQSPSETVTASDVEEVYRVRQELMHGPPCAAVVAAAYAEQRGFLAEAVFEDASVLRLEKTGDLEGNKHAEEAGDHDHRKDGTQGTQEGRYKTRNMGWENSDPLPGNHREA